MVTVASLTAVSVIVIRHLSEWLSRRDHDRDFTPPSFIAIGEEP